MSILRVYAMQLRAFATHFFEPVFSLNNTAAQNAKKVRLWRPRTEKSRPLLRDPVQTNISSGNTVPPYMCIPGQVPSSVAYYPPVS